MTFCHRGAQWNLSPWEPPPRTTLPPLPSALGLAEHRVAQCGQQQSRAAPVLSKASAAWHHGGVTFEAAYLCWGRTGAGHAACTSPAARQRYASAHPGSLAGHRAQPHNTTKTKPGPAGRLGIQHQAQGKCLWSRGAATAAAWGTTARLSHNRQHVGPAQALLFPPRTAPQGGSKTCIPIFIHGSTHSCV